MKDELPKTKAKKRLLGKEFVELADKIRNGGGWQGTHMIQRISPIPRHWDSGERSEDIVDKINQILDVLNLFIDQYNAHESTKTNQGGQTQAEDRTLKGKE